MFQIEMFVYERATDVTMAHPAVIAYTSFQQTWDAPSMDFRRTIVGMVRRARHLPQDTKVLSRLLVLVTYIRHRILAFSRCAPSLSRRRILPRRPEPFIGSTTQL